MKKMLAVALLVLWPALPTLAWSADADPGLGPGPVTASTGRIMPVMFDLVCAGAQQACSLLNQTLSGTSTFTGQALFADGTVVAPGAAFASQPGMGIYRIGSNQIGVTGASNTPAFGSGFTVTGVKVPSNGQYGFTSSSAMTGAEDLTLRRTAAASLQLGGDVNGAPINQSFRAHNGITGTDIKGASLTLAGGLGTGAAASNPLTLNRVVVKATGTTAQTYSPAMVVCPTKILSNTSATVQAIATITTTSTTAGSVTMDYATTANNGTLQDQDSGVVKVSWNNNAGTVAAAMTAVVLQSDSDASGTLATTPTTTVATNVVTINFTPTWVTIVPTTVTGYATFLVHSGADTVVCQ